MFSVDLLSLPEDIKLSIERVEAIFVSIDTIVPIKGFGKVNIAFLSEEEIRALNFHHRGKDRSTDVLSFHYFDDFSGLSMDDIAGEIVLSLEHIRIQAHEQGHSLEKETEILIIHSILHLLGYDHETDEDYQEMWSYESILREKL